LYCIVFSLLWSMMLTGVSPSIEAIPTSFKWIWDLSVRYFLILCKTDLFSLFRCLVTWLKPSTSKKYLPCHSRNEIRSAVALD
jgi:hypothetical protein